MELDSVRSLKLQVFERFSRGFPRSTATAYRLVSGPGGRARRAAPPATPKHVALGISGGKDGAKGDYRLAVRFYGDQDAESQEVLHYLASIAHNEVDVRYPGEAFPLSALPGANRHRPLAIGVSVGHPNVSAGTLGCFARLRTTDEPVLVSNNHVLANVNQAKIGDPILQPGAFDGGTLANDVIGALHGFVKLRSGVRNRMDAAIASILPDAVGSVMPFFPLRGQALDLDDNVTKTGRTTFKTAGRVVAFDVDDVPIRYGPGTSGKLRFNGLIEIEGVLQAPFAKPGDSGSIVVNSHGEAAALLFGGTRRGGSNGQGLSYATDLKDVFDHFGLY